MSGKGFDGCPPSGSGCPPDDDDCPPSTSRSSMSKGKAKAFDDCPPSSSRNAPAKEPCDDFDDGCPGPDPQSSRPKQSGTVSRSLPIQPKVSTSKSRSTTAPRTELYSHKPAERTQIKSKPKSKDDMTAAKAPAKSESRTAPTVSPDFYSSQPAERTAIKPKPRGSSASSAQPSQSRSRTNSTNNQSSSAVISNTGGRPTQVVPYRPSKDGVRDENIEGMYMITLGPESQYSHDGYAPAKTGRMNSKPLLWKGTADFILDFWQPATKRASMGRPFVTQPHPNPASLRDWGDDVRFDCRIMRISELVDVSYEPHYLELPEVDTLFWTACKNASLAAEKGNLPWEMIRRFADNGEYNEDWSNWSSKGSITVTTNRTNPGCAIAAVYTHYRAGYRFIGTARKVQGDIITWDLVDVDRYQWVTGTQLPPTEVMRGWWSPFWYKYEYGEKERDEQPEEWSPELRRNDIYDRWFPVARFVPVIPVIPVVAVPYFP